MAGRIDISVVIPTRDRWPILEGTLEALAQQATGEATFEIVAVDNGSSDGTREELERLAALGGDPPLVVVAEPLGGAGAARNAGVRAARGELILFIGDDCRPADARFLAGHLEAHAGDPPEGAAVIGRVDWDPAVERTAVMDWLMRSGKGFDFERAEREPPGAYLLYTSNASLPRRALVEAGGFDERFPGCGYEDFELGLRLEDRGLRWAYRPDLVVHHVHRYDLRQSLARMEHAGRNAHLLNRVQGDRQPLPGPRPVGLKGFAGRALAPAFRRVPPPPGLRGGLRDRWYQVVHYSALASGYGSAPIAEEPSRNGAALAAAAPTERPAVSVIVPFAGDAAAARALESELAGLRRAEGDELIVVDNRPEGADPLALGGGIAVIAATSEQSAYHARNVGAGRAANEWLLFVDADCGLPPTLLDDYFAAPVARNCGAVAGEVRGADDRSRAARYASSRGHLSQETNRRHPYRQFGVTANLLVRREAWRDVGGFAEGIRSGGDADLCWRLQDAGWALEHSELAAVEHHHRRTLRALVRQALGYGAGRAWLDRRHRGASPRPKALGRLARCAGGAAVWTVTAHPERALFKLYDAAVVAAESAGYLLHNRAQRAGRAAATQVVLMRDIFPRPYETFVTGEARALRRLGVPVRFEASARPPGPVAPARDLDVAYIEDDGILERHAALARLVLRHPLRCARDRMGRRHFREEDAVRSLWVLAPMARRIERGGERHLHVHFAGPIALDALRFGRLLGTTYSVALHGFDIFQRPRNLRPKLEGAAFAVTACEYSARHLRGLVAPADRERIHKMVVGVDGERFVRHRPHPAARTVLAVGRLVEKKGFGYLVEAAARLRVERMWIVGDGPLRDELERQIARLGLEDTVELLGARGHEEVRELLEQAAVVAMPSVVAADGDRDTMPVVVKEALAMEVPVVASDEVGLPEVVHEGWGRLAPPGDPEALAGALGELLDLSPEARAEMGRAGRAFVLEHCSVDAEAARLVRLIEAARE